MSRLLPYETIVKAHEGDPEAVDAVLSHYAGYIRYFSKMNGQVNTEVEDYVKERLIACLLKFQFIYSILCKPCVFKAYRLLNIQTLCIFPCFCPYEPKQGKFFMLRRLPYPVVLRKYASLPL